MGFSSLTAVSAAMATVIIVVIVSPSETLAQYPPAPTPSGVSITYQFCQSPMCTYGCQSQSFTPGQCISVAGKPKMSVSLQCRKHNTMMCSQAAFYSDSKCTNRVETADSACNSCQNGFSIACGALWGATFVVTNCTDPSCNHCSKPTIVPYKHCKQIGSRYGMVQAPQWCDTVKLHLFLNSSSCAGSYAKAEYWQGRCNDGKMLSCSGGNATTMPPPPLNSKQPVIDLDFDKIRFL